jgi:hypothetical protein
VPRWNDSSKYLEKTLSEGTSCVFEYKQSDGYLYVDDVKTTHRNRWILVWGVKRGGSSGSTSNSTAGGGGGGVGEIICVLDCGQSVKIICNSGSSTQIQRKNDGLTYTTLLTANKGGDGSNTTKGTGCTGVLNNTTGIIRSYVRTGGDGGGTGGSTSSIAIGVPDNAPDMIEGNIGGASGGSSSNDLTIDDPGGGGASLLGNGGSAVKDSKAVNVGLGHGGGASGSWEDNILGQPTGKNSGGAGRAIIRY